MSNLRVGLLESATFTEVVAAEEVPAALVLLGGQRLRLRKVILLLVVLRPGRVGLPLLLLFGDAVAAGGERRRQTVQVFDVCKDAILKILNKCFERGGRLLKQV